MKWYSDKKSNFKNTLIPYRLYALSEEIYDEIELRDDGYYLIKRCGEKPATIGHGETIFINDGKTLIYPLPEYEIKEIKLDWIPPDALGLYTSIGMGSNTLPILEGAALIDRRFIFERQVLQGTLFSLPNRNPEKKCFVEKVSGSEEGVGQVDIDGVYININIYKGEDLLNTLRVNIGRQLFSGEYLSWNEVMHRYDIFTEEGIIPTDIQKIVIEELDFDRIEVDTKIDLSVPTRILRHLDTPTGISLYNESKDRGIAWNHVTGAERYEVYLNGELLAVTEYNGYITPEEFEGHIRVRAINDYQQSEFTEEIYIKSTPNEPYLSFIENYVENNEHVFKVHFVDCSDIETLYRVRWSLDGRDEVVDEILGSGGRGTVYVHTIKVPDIANSMTIRVTSVNETGETITVEPVTKYITSTPIWTYRKASSDLLLEWRHNVAVAKRYKIIIDDDGSIHEEYAIIENDVGTNIRHSVSLQEDRNAKVTLVAIDDDGEHIHTKPIMMGMSLDKTLIAPTMTYTRLSDTDYEFVWDDIYTNEKEFEIVYSVSGGAIQRVIIPTTSSLTTGRKYRFNFTFEDYGSVNVKVRMNWDLGNSDYSNEVQVYYIPSNTEAPSYIRRDRRGNGDVYQISWEGQQYVKEYELWVKEGYLAEEKILKAQNNSLNYELKAKPVPFPEPLTAEDKNKWLIDIYPATNASGNYPVWSWIEGLEKTSTRIYSDHLLSMNMNLGDRYVAHFYTNVYVDDYCTLETTLKADQAASLWLNRNLIHGSINSGGTKIKFNFVPGWNTIEIILMEAQNADGLQFGEILSQNPLIKTMTHLDKVLTFREPTLEFKVRSIYLDDTYSEYSNSMVFTPEASLFQTENTTITNIKEVKPVNTINLERDTEVIYDLSTKSSTITDVNYRLNSMMSTLYTISEGPYAMQFSGKDLRTESPYTARIVLSRSRQAADILNTLSVTDATIDTQVGTYVKTRCTLPQYIYTEVNKVRIMTIGDSITAGHPGHWAETMTGDERSQYQYWLNRRLKNQFEIINKGYGSDTTDRMLARFDKDVLGYNASYCIIQGGTNDLYWAMAESDGNQAALDAKVQVMKDNIREMVKRCWDNGIHPIVGTLIPRTGAVGIYKQALYDYNEWIIMFCSTNENIDYIDFFNAGKEAFPPTPLEDPTNPGALNPIYDGDAIYDEFGNLIKQGRGIHPDVQGYKIMGECIPLSLFQTAEDGLKLYTDKECTVEEKFNDQDKLRPFYELNVDNIRRGNLKHVVRYLKNIGGTQTLYSVFATNEHSVEVRFLDEDGNKMPYTNGLLAPGRSAEVKIEFNVLNDDTKSTVDLHIASRKLVIN